MVELTSHMEFVLDRIFDVNDSMVINANFTNVNNLAIHYYHHFAFRNVTIYDHQIKNRSDNPFDHFDTNTELRVNYCY